MNVHNKAEREQAEIDPDEIPLTRAPLDCSLKLSRVSGGRQFQHRLADMGLTVGTRFSIVSGQSSGPVIVAVRGTRLAVGKGMVHRMFVKRA